MCVCVCVCAQWFITSKELNNLFVVPCHESIGKTCVSLVEVYVEIEGSCEKFPIVCLEGEKILLVVEEWLMKNHKVLMKHC